jgi:hypothetical protein
MEVIVKQCRNIENEYAGMHKATWEILVLIKANLYN